MSRSNNVLPLREATIISVNCEIKLVGLLMSIFEEIEGMVRFLHIGHSMQTYESVHTLRDTPC